jgi:hypothetical protein
MRRRRGSGYRLRGGASSAAGAGPCFVLFLLNALNFFDAHLGRRRGAAAPRMGAARRQIGWIGTAFTLLYAVVGLPLGRWPTARGAPGSSAAARSCGAR